MDSNPYWHGSNFVDLLTSQQGVFSLVEETVPEDTPAERKERRMWTPVEDMVLISSRLNTSKDHVFYRYSFKYRKYDGCSNKNS